ncbi:LysR family transcriptional regulator [Chelatococcus asaccharovorans]|uniref:LysR family transcriptional regulator n=1 Tax=Chelatococcus asaccharovorans TaxID=28210 RepID=UPI00224C66C4|nr:LysR family transcriptional regulator [Chelatococcus asaccharovorans]CAH1667607.1 DNA-binding transcriptional LysR family regulator [Chelatococcus asaccharovorans]CAH1680811.1 DNA-binding transcriptional LysR family regulator [Chelatococcus asaccharovorans]
MLTLRQIEIIRAIMVTGSIAGAAKLLNVSAPGLSRLMKYTEASLGVRLFDRRAGRFVPTTEARHIFNLLDSVHGKIADLQAAIADLGRGTSQELRIASVPSIANVMLPRAVAQLRLRYPDLGLDINILKIEEAIDYLLLGRGELVAISSRFDHPLIEFALLARGRLLCIVPQDSPLAARDRITPAEMAEHPLIGIDPRDPYGSIMAAMFTEASIDYRMNIKARFGTTVCSLVAAGLGIAIIDEFTVAHNAVRGLKSLEIDAENAFYTYAAYRNDLPLSAYAEQFLTLLRADMTAWSQRSRPMIRSAAEHRP